MGLVEQSWRRDAACRDVPSAIFFPEGSVAERATIQTAKEICARCPVQEQCLAVGLMEPFGIWGGLTEPERRPLRNKPRGQAA
jgi:WhiB family redox-sensing transcriptional regulator